MPEFIALRKTPRLKPEVRLEEMSVPTKRSVLAKDAPLSKRVDTLKDLGLRQIMPEERAPEIKHGFQRLGYVGAYVVNAPSEKKSDQAKQVLEPDYHIMPNIQLSLPLPTRLGERLARERRRSYWPAESGIGTAHRNGITGSGVLVGVLDTGCDADHYELAKKRIEFRYVPMDPAPDDMRAVRGFDVEGHGTHVCDIIAGRNVGVAPGVDLMVASVIESETLKTSLERIVIALDWMLSNFQTEENLNKPMIISMSLGFQPQWISAPDLQTVMDGIQLLLKTLVNDFDVLPVIAIGNDGPGNMRAPAYFPEALAVGAVDFKLHPAPFSGGGISPVTGNKEPDIAGYGVEVFSSLERDADNKSWYARMSGTSMATPYVTGIAALLASANPGLQGNALRQRLINQALPLGAPLERVGAGLARFT
jgi:subtilisin family serine protease